MRWRRANYEQFLEQRSPRFFPFLSPLVREGAPKGRERGGMEVLFFKVRVGVGMGFQPPLSQPLSREGRGG
jgi:hypothetical protein